MNALERIQHEVINGIMFNDDTVCNIPIGITISVDGRIMLKYTLQESVDIFHTFTEVDMKVNEVYDKLHDLINASRDYPSEEK